MSDTTSVLRLKIAEAGQLRSVVRTMKAVASASIGQYRKAELALNDYERSVELGLGVCLRAAGASSLGAKPAGSRAPRTVRAVVFGSDQGLVGRFNDVVADLAVRELKGRKEKIETWAVGARIVDLLTEAGLTPIGRFAVPSSVGGISALVGEVLVGTGEEKKFDDADELRLYYNRAASGAAYAAVCLRLLPLDESWRRDRASMRWPAKALPSAVGDGMSTLRALIREYLFTSLFRACAESLTSENASRLAAMTRADKNISDIQKKLDRRFHRLRQSAIDDEMFDVVAAFEALGGARR
jgi:F-type H+-transporting ATPase subunit gamma